MKTSTLPNRFVKHKCYLFNMYINMMQRSYLCKCCAATDKTFLFVVSCINCDFPSDVSFIQRYMGRDSHVTILCEGLDSLKMPPCYYYVFFPCYYFMLFFRVIILCYFSVLLFDVVFPCYYVVLFFCVIILCCMLVFHGHQVLFHQSLHTT